MPVKLQLDIAVREAAWKTRLKPYVKTIRVACEAALQETSKRKKIEISVVLANDAFVRELNHTYRRKNKPTNVLSFDGEGEYLGDIVLALETIQREAKQQGKTFRDHATHLIVHGVLHLLGHDHERDKDAAAMEEKEVKILKKLGVKNPYL